MRRRPLFWQIFPVSLLISLCTVLAVSWFATTTFKTFYYDQMVVDIEARALLLEQKILDLVLDSPDALQDFCRQAGRRAHTRITVVGPYGAVLADSNEDPQRMEKHGKRPEITKAYSGQTGSSLRFSTTLHRDMLYVAIPLRLSSADHADKTGALRLSVPATALNTVLGTIRNRVVLASLLTILLAAVFSRQLALRISRPLEEIKRGAEQLSSGEKIRLVNIHEHGLSLEMSGLIISLNRMAEQLMERILLTRRQHNELEAVFSSMTEAVVAVDAEECVIRLNRAAGLLFRIDPQIGKDKPVQGMLRNPELMEMIRGTLRNNNCAAAEVELFDGQQRTILEVRVVPLQDNEQQPIGALMVMDDVTRINRLENVRREFVANVSHELKTPITVIKGYVETLLDGGVAAHEDGNKFLQIVLRQAGRLDAIIDDLLSLSRIENTANSHKTSLDLALKELYPTLHAALQTCKLKADEQQIRLDLQCPPDLKAIHNPALLEEAVINLLNNAVTYSPSGSSVFVRAESRQESGKKQWVEIAVEDKGCGIRKEHLDRIFERFYRCDKARSRENGGTGLGLAIVKHIAQSQRGTVEVESHFGRGSTFTLNLPG
ncbi:two-component system, OmpR family, phosphate regulon sensor histidine kinase PhoR [Candidatus Electrothrix marina]|uniref:histidine kinase n=1 Tax=Candidatus Electrothrix marina TaxID=1859130 RepID=A0A444JDM5_9BACT|nr:two-component system, OmpR family, phosphate regulon sensor histidine kinase PhoR [Candidatus Electrothrix marina]